MALGYRAWPAPAGMQDAYDGRSAPTYRGGDGDPLVLVHGLMGRGSTWSRQLPWLTRLGAVYTYDAPWHRGRDVADPHPISTERFVDDLGAMPSRHWARRCR